MNDVAPVRLSKQASVSAHSLKMAFVAGGDGRERVVCDEYRRHYGDVPTEQADVIVLVGGNTAVIEAMHRFANLNIPVFPLSVGYKGFLTNESADTDLRARVAQADPVVISPLSVRWITFSGQEGHSLAFNEVTLFRQTRRMARIEVKVNGHIQLSPLIGDGILLATPAGSTAYNLSVGGPILPITARLLTLTPIAPFRPRRWRGALLPNSAKVDFFSIGAEEAPVTVTADFLEARDIMEASVQLAAGPHARLLFDPGGGIGESLIVEQFHSS